MVFWDATEGKLLLKNCIFQPFTKAKGTFLAISPVFSKSIPVFFFRRSAKISGEKWTRRAFGMNLISSALLLVVLTLCQDGVYSKKKMKNSKRPNIIFILMDDLDIQLGSMQVMTKTRTMFEKHGAEFVNAFVTSPICCPSRSSILTGMYAHNHGCLTNTVNCASAAWRRGPEKKNFGYYIQQTGYKTGKSNIEISGRK